MLYKKVFFVNNIYIYIAQGYEPDGQGGRRRQTQSLNIAPRHHLRSYLRPDLNDSLLCVARYLDVFAFVCVAWCICICMCCKIYLYMWQDVFVFVCVARCFLNL